MKIGDKVVSKPDDGSGIWIVQDLFPDNLKRKTVAKLKLFLPFSNKEVISFDTTDNLRKVSK